MISLISCSGKCKRSKIPGLFTPSQLKTNTPVCRACQKKMREKYQPASNARPGEAWRGWAGISFKGSRPMQGSGVGL